MDYIFILDFLFYVERLLIYATAENFPYSSTCPIPHNSVPLPLG